MDTLYNDKYYIKAKNRYLNKYPGLFKGISAFGNTEHEVILDIKMLKINEIESYGGYSSDAKILATKLYGHIPSAIELVDFENELKQNNLTVGPDWIEGAAKDRIIRKHMGCPNYFK